MLEMEFGPDYLYPFSILVRDRAVRRDESQTDFQNKRVLFTLKEHMQHTF